MRLTRRLKISIGVSFILLLYISWFINFQVHNKTNHLKVEHRVYMTSGNDRLANVELTLFSPLIVLDQNLFGAEYIRGKVPP